MWMQLLTLALASYCLAMPQKADTNQPNLDELIGSVFGSNPETQTQNNLDEALQQIFSTTTSKTKPISNDQGSDLNTLIDEYAKTSTQSSITGISNTPKPSLDGCECVPYYLCRNNTILKDGMGLIDIRAGGPCVDYLDVCCKTPDQIPPENKPTPPPTQRKGCGRRQPDGVGFRIIGDGDNETKFGEFPWMVAILKYETIGESNEKLNVYQCGGSLIHKQAVLTAAHCVHGKKPSDLKVRAGEWDTQTRNEIFSHQDRNVQTVIVHKDFDSGTLKYDFAILILEQPVQLEENVDIVCLSDINDVFDGNNCFATGWGKNKFGKEGHYQVILKKVELPVVPHSTCQNSLRNTRLGKYFELHETFICAGGVNGKDTCKGDGGSPLVCASKTDRNRYQQAGIVAWGIGCGENGIPGVYGNVAHARQWIDEQMAFYNLDNTVYNL